MKSRFPRTTDDASDRIPRYVQVEQDLVQAIDSGKYLPGERLPDERQLAEQYSVSRGTIRQALERLNQACKVERHQGRGTFVAQVTEKAGYICVVAVGDSARDTLRVATAIAQAEQTARSHGLKVCVRYANDAEELRLTVVQVNADRTIAGGLIVGTVPPCDLARWTRSGRVLWVMVADFAAPRRDVPVIDQVVPDWYDLHERMTQQAIDKGAESPALWVLGKQWVWAAESVSAFRTVCDAAGVSAANQQIFDLHTYRKEPTRSVAQYHRAVARIMLETMDNWEKSGRWPDHLIVPGTSVLTWLECLRARPKAAERLEQAPMTAWTLAEHRNRVAPQFAPIHITWALMSVADQIEQSVIRLLDTPSNSRTPARVYVRGCEFIETPPSRPE